MTQGCSLDHRCRSLFEFGCELRKEPGLGIQVKGLSQIVGSFSLLQQEVIRNCLQPVSVHCLVCFNGVFASFEPFSELLCVTAAYLFHPGNRENTCLVLPFRLVSVLLMQLCHKFFCLLKKLWLKIMICFDYGINT